MWATTTFAERSRPADHGGRAARGELPDIAHVVTTEMGKPFAQAKGEVAKCASGFRWFAEHAERLLADEEVPVDASRGMITYQPLGAVLAIMPWNFPLWQVARFIAPAVMAGNVGLLKHAPNVPRTALLLEDLFRRAGAPDGVLQTLLIGTDQVPAIIADPRVAAVTLTGSVGAGRAVAAQAGAVGKKIVLELGGSDPFIVLPVRRPRPGRPVGVQARVQNAGQSCIAAKRFIVHAEWPRSSPAGSWPAWRPCRWATPSTRPPRSGRWSPPPPATPSRPRWRTPGPRGPPSCAAANGSSAPTGPDHPGFFYRPTVITGITPAMRVATEEVFGPVALLFTAADADEALALANGTEFGLGSSVWTTDPTSSSGSSTGCRPARSSSTAWSPPCPSCPSAASRARGSVASCPRSASRSSATSSRCGSPDVADDRPDRDRAYLDHAATTPMRPEAVEAMLPVPRRSVRQPVGGHAESRRARMAVDDARDQIAELLGADPGEVVFTVGRHRGRQPGRRRGLGGRGPPARTAGVVVCTAMEHHAVLHACRALAGRTGAELREVPTDKDGIVDLDALAEACDRRGGPGVGDGGQQRDRHGPAPRRGGHDGPRACRPGRPPHRRRPGRPVARRRRADRAGRPGGGQRPQVRRAQGGGRPGGPARDRRRPR